MQQEEKTRMEEGETSSQQTGMSFGITKDTKSKNATPLKVATKLETATKQFPYGYEFPVASLVNVISNSEFDTKNGKTAVLQFIFRDSQGSQHTHIEFKIDETDAKFQSKMEGMNVRIKHIFTAVFGSFPEEGLGTGATSFEQFFQKVSEAFNSKTTEDGKKVYANHPLYYKLTYYKANLNFPLSPNFLERYHKDRACGLSINTRYDNLEPKTASAGSMFGGLPGIGGEAPSDLPNFEEGFS